MVTTWQYGKLVTIPVYHIAKLLPYLLIFGITIPVYHIAKLLPYLLIFGITIPVYHIVTLLIKQKCQL
jgi:hypothetical protein